MTYATTYDTLVNNYTIFNGAVEITNGATLDAGWYVTTNVTEKLILVLENNVIVTLSTSLVGSRWDIYSKVISNQNVTPLSMVSTSGETTVTPTITIASTPFVSKPRNYQAFVSSGELYINVDGDAFKITDGSLDGAVDVTGNHDLAFDVELAF